MFIRSGRRQAGGGRLRHQWAERGGPSCGRLKQKTSAQFKRDEALRPHGRCSGFTKRHTANWRWPDYYSETSRRVMLARCFQGLARPITRRGLAFGAFKISFGSSSGARCPVLSGAPHALTPSGHGRLIAYPTRLGLDPLWIILSLLLPHLVALPLIYNTPLAQKGSRVCFPFEDPSTHRGYPQRQGPEVGLDGRSLMVKGLSSRKKSRHHL